MTGLILAALIAAMASSASVNPAQSAATAVAQGKDYPPASELQHYEGLGVDYGRLLAEVTHVDSTGWSTPSSPSDAGVAQGTPDAGATSIGAGATGAPSAPTAAPGATTPLPTITWGAPTLYHGPAGGLLELFPQNPHPVVAGSKLGYDGAICEGSIKIAGAWLPFVCAGIDVLGSVESSGPLELGTVQLIPHLGLLADMLQLGAVLTAYTAQAGAWFNGGGPGVGLGIGSCVPISWLLGG